VLRLLKFKKVQFILKYQFKKIKNGLIELVLGSAWIGLAAALLVSPPPRLYLNILIDGGEDLNNFPIDPRLERLGFMPMLMIEPVARVKAVCLA
jgi:hypothetical protein